MVPLCPPGKESFSQPDIQAKSKVGFQAHSSRFWSTGFYLKFPLHLSFLSLTLQTHLQHILSVFLLLFPALYGFPAWTPFLIFLPSYCLSLLSSQFHLQLMEPGGTLTFMLLPKTPYLKLSNDFWPYSLWLAKPTNYHDPLPSKSLPWPPISAYT